MAASIPTLDEIRATVREELERLLGARSGLLTTEEAAELVDVRPKTIREWAKSGRLRVERRRGRRLFLREEDVIAARANGPADPGAALVGSLRARSG